MSRPLNNLLISLMLLLACTPSWAQDSVPDRAPGVVSAAEPLTSAALTPPGDGQYPQELVSYHIDKVLVEKSKRRMLLLQEGEAVRHYRISLGSNPEGHKLFSGDQRTPEGSYTLDARNPDSDFYKSIRISYPSQEDRRKARAWGQDPGGAIMIHGLPNGAGEFAFAYLGLDWTEGCIAVSNEEMDEIWQLVRNGTPIEIRP